ncbi:MAG: tRNA 2-thiouridine(34) synthase MnmA [Myxococcales bacterium]|nr:tRNA 2-thiouridine(34) synthase MnmA [Myxococcales bacterium]MCB9643418.1 tRNA 2-thiouridine(34) synthase MnmA [Myxococcales bacterium]
MKIAVLASGGVDSSVALRLLHEQGHDLTAFYIKIWLEDDLAFLGDCPWEEDMAYVRSICDDLGVPLEVISLQKEYWEQVVQYTIDEVKAGRTPNPDIHCNARIKFGTFYQKIDDSFERVATGHYARWAEEDGVAYLKTAVDSWKDQTYFLAHLRQEQLKRAMFPIGDYTKSAVREMASRFQLPNSRRKDSQGICFLGTIRYSEFIKHHLGERTGNLVEFESGRVMGQHPGFWYYTLGQRQGIGLGNGPWYVVRKDVHENIVYISRNYDAIDRLRACFFVESPNWLSNFSPPVGEKFACRVKVRHGEQMYQAEVLFETPERATVWLDKSDQGLAPGQYAVFYQEDVCLGCAVIAEGVPTA